MLHNPLHFLRHILALGVCLLALGQTAAWAWGPEGHSAVGVLAFEEARPETQAAIKDILGTDDPEAISTWCNWPDDYKYTVAGKWSRGLHYTDLPHGATAYDAARDCPDGNCVTAAIVKYAGELADRDLSRNARQQAYGFICHFVGDIHQPLHVGFKSDLGGNTVDISWRGQDLNLHQFWDSAVIDQHASNWKALADIVRQVPASIPAQAWQPADVVAWTNETHTLAREQAYPAHSGIDDAFAQQSWALIQQRLATASGRLAGMLDTLLAPAPQ